MTTDREAAEWVARTYPADAHPTVAALAAAYLRALALHAAELDEPEWACVPDVACCGHCCGGIQESVDRHVAYPCPTVQALDLTRRGCPGCGALIPNDMARCALCGWPTEVTP